MKTRVYKYPLNIGGVSIVEVPINSVFLSVKSQGDEVVVYFSVPTVSASLKEIDSHKFYVVGTGHEFESDKEMSFIDTVLLYEDSFVLHVFKA